MKNCIRYILIFFLLIQPFVGYSQFFVGDSKEFVTTMLKKGKIEFTEDRVTDATNRISWIFEKEYQMILVLDINDIVIRQTLIPERKSGVNDFVKLFNLNYVTVSETEWINYDNGRIYTIQLRHLLREPFFSITLAPSSNK